jgi:prepilin-type processing-associated H-X9-DG protein
MANGPRTADDPGRTRLLAGACPAVAVLSLVLGLLSVALLGNLVAALPALALGFVSLRWVNESDGRLWGRLPAVAGMVLGGVGTLLGIAGLVALVLVPTREKADQVQCQFNLMQIGIAVNLYHDQRQPHAFPPAVVPNAALPADRPDRHLSWLAALLPNLGEAAGPAGTARGTPQRVAQVRQAAEHLDLTRAWDAEENRQAVNTSLPQLLCPGNPNRAAAGTPGLTHYVGIAGVDPDAAGLPATDPRAGFFGYERQLSRDDLVPEGEQGGPEGRGTSHIIMVVETAHDNGPWAQGGPATVRSLDPAQRPYSGPGRPFGGCHPGGFNALFVDGSVMFFKDSFDPKKFEALVLLRTARGGP